MSAIPHHTSDPVCPLCEAKLGLADPFLRTWFIEQVKPAFPDAHISWSYRDQVAQKQAYEDGKSKLHFPMSAHNKTPAQALDLFEINEGGEGVWNPSFFAKINAMNESKGIKLLWGAHFRDLGDSDHFQLLV